jgi:drug/metabolite transporter (DMT)-like permease
MPIQCRMSQKLSPSTALMLTVPPLLWAGNAVIGRMVNTLVPPITLNLLRWAVAFVILLPLAAWVLRRGSGLWSHWRRFALLSLLGVGCYNALQYLALQTSTPLNVTLVAASGPVWMLAIGALFFQAPVRRAQMYGATLSILGVLVVLSRGDWAQLLAVRLVVGDLFILLATACWSWYSWLLSRRNEPEAIRNDWAAFLLAQVVFGLAWSSLFAGMEWGLTDAHITWGWPLVSALAFVSIGPAVLAYRCWGLGIQQAGSRGGGLFCEPHATVRSHLLGCLSGRITAIVSRAGLCADHCWDLGVISSVKASKLTFASRGSIPHRFDCRRHNGF